MGDIPAPRRSGSSRGLGHFLVLSFLARLPGRDPAFGKLLHFVSGALELPVGVCSERLSELV